MTTKEAEDTIKFFLLRKKKSSKTRNLVHFIHIKGKDFVFKCPIAENSDIFLTNEVIASHILADIKAPTVEYKRATARGFKTKTEGNISPNFLNSKEEALTLRQVDKLIKMGDLYKDRKIFERTFFVLHPLDVLSKKCTFEEKVAILSDETEKISTLPILKNGTVSKRRYEINRYIDEISHQQNISYIGRYVYEIEELSKMLNYKIEGNLEDELIKMAVADIVTGQPDRHDNNISVILNNKEKTIRLAPMYDNEFAFFATNYEILDDVIVLSQKHYEMLADTKTEVGKYYQNVKDYFVSGKLEERLSSLKQEFEKPEKFWSNIEDVYSSGIDLIDSKIENIKIRKQNFKF